MALTTSLSPLRAAHGSPPSCDLASRYRTSIMLHRRRCSAERYTGSLPMHLIVSQTRQWSHTCSGLECLQSPLTPVAMIHRSTQRSTQLWMRRSTLTTARLCCSIAFCVSEACDCTS